MTRGRTLSSRSGDGIIRAATGALVSRTLGGILVGSAGGYLSSYRGGAIWEEQVSLRTRQAIDEGVAGKYRISPTTDPRIRNQWNTYGSFR